jgi:hypothetical protein
LKDEFVLKKGKVKISATAGSILSYKGEGLKYLSPEKQHDFWSGVGKLLHLSKWSRPKIKNAVRDLSRGMTQATEEVYTCGLLLAPEGQWSVAKMKNWSLKGCQIQPTQVIMIQGAV